MIEGLLEHTLVWVVGLPAGVALFLATTSLLLGLANLPPLPASVWRVLGLGAAVATEALAWLGPGRTFDAERLGLQFVWSFGWSEALGADLMLGVEGIGLCFLLSTVTIAPLAMLASWRRADEAPRAWIFVCLALESALLGAISSVNLLSYVFFQALALVPVLFWLGRWGGIGRARAASRLWTLESAGLACLLFVVFVLREAGIEQFGEPVLGLAVPGGGPGLLDLRLGVDDQRMLLVAFLAAVAIRMPVVPLHFWLPGAQAAAPTGLSMMLATGFVQTAAVGLFRFALPLFPDAFEDFGPWLSWLGIAALAYASLVALVQKELKRLLAYACAGTAGFAFFGISTLTVQGLTGATMQLIAHGAAAAGLFALVGALAARRHTTEVSAFGGLARPMPVCAFFFSVLTFSIMGMPALGGFVGDLFVLLGSLEARRRLSLIALIAMVVSASYLLWLQRRLFQGPVENPENRGLIDLDRLERFVALALLIPIVWIGVYPNPVLRRVEPSVLEILHQMDRRRAERIPELPDAPRELVDAARRAPVDR